MTGTTVPATSRQLAAIVRKGEGPSLEFKRSAGEKALKEHEREDGK